MKKITPVLLLAALLAGCGQQKDPLKAPKKAAHAANNAPLFHYGNSRLLQYDRYVAGLDTQLIDMGSQAIDTFQLLFKTQSPAVCDTAFYIFNQFQAKLCSYLGEHMEADSIKYEEIAYGTDMEGKKVTLSKKQKAVKKKLEKNGFGLDSEEGIAFIVEDLHFISQHFGKYVTEPMKQYLAQLDKEQKEGFQEDAGLTIEPAVLANRTVWWEQFSKSVANTNFLYAKEAATNYNLLLYVLMEGMDNTSVRAWVKDNLAEDSLSEYYRNVWTYLQEKHPQSNANAVVTPYFNAWLKRNTTEISQVLNNFKKEHKSPWGEGD